jgi:hypothetical protein
MAYEMLLCKGLIIARCTHPSMMIWGLRSTNRFRWLDPSL